MSIDGIKRGDPRRVDLSEFFEDERWVELRLMTPHQKAEMSELAMEGMEFRENAKQKSGVSALPVAKGSAARNMQVRDMKLEHCIADHNVTADGKKTGWAFPLWKELDDANPQILEKVIVEINDHNGFAAKEVEEAENPT